MTRKKKQEAEHDNSERWLLTYSDLITLLMIFFVVMYAISNVDAQKYQNLSKSLEGALNPAAFTGAGASGAGNDSESDADSSGSGADELSAEELAAALAEGTTNKLDPELVAAAEEIQQLINQNGLQDKVSVSVQERGVVVGLMNTVLFDPGSAQIKQDAMSTLIAIGKIANGVHNYIRIEGNTDDVPQSSARFPSNWELSVIRATEVVKLLIEKSGVEANRISAVGYGEYRPSVPNTSAENRAKNRKVDIVILSDQLDKSESSMSSNNEMNITENSSTENSN